MIEQFTRPIERSEYDPFSDILYVHFLNDKGDSYGDDFENGVEIFRDSLTDEITGFQVYHLNGCEDERQKQMNTMGLSYSLKSLYKK
ncbi:MAG: hypothetical protein IJ088_07430 [Clostridia bacterium]|nr:hypothetical protein [Clostridia bacterium]